LFWRPFRGSPAPTTTVAWWRDADAAADAPSAAVVEDLARRIAMDPGAADPDEAERQEEMLAGLTDLLELAGQALPILQTQHRAIRTDVCHLIAPVSLGVDAGAAGKLFLTSARLLVVGGVPAAWPWHRVRRVDRAGRDLVITATGGGHALVLGCNTYGDALAAAHIARRLASV
jgi:hypothetical protein